MELLIGLIYLGFPYFAICLVVGVIAAHLGRPRRIHITFKHPWDDE